MKIQSMKRVCFSPTGTTRSILQGVTRGIDQGAVDLIDITKPIARERPLQASEHDLLVVAVPVYAGRVPALIREWLQAIDARNSPAVCIVVYGNREYDDALLELRDILKKCGCKPIACAAYIGEHSFSSTDTPIAVARPDAKDINHAELLGREIKKKLLSITSIDDVADINVPGNYPYRELEPLLSVDFIDTGDACTQCGVCAEACPVGAIDPEDSHLLDKEKCILCCACIKTCPHDAKTMKSGAVKDIAVRLHEMCKKRKEPVYFL